MYWCPAMPHARTSFSARSRISIVLIFFGFSCLTDQAAPPTGSDVASDVVVLPTFVVSDSRTLPPPESWRYANGAGYEVLTQISARKTNELIEDFLLFREALRIVFPGLETSSELPVTFIFCGRGQFEVLAPAESRSANATVGRASYFVHGRESAFVVLDLATDEVNIGNADGDDPLSARDTLAGIQVDVFQQLRRQYLFALYARQTTRLPAWFEEGLAQLLMRMSVDRKLIRFAVLEEPTVDQAPESLIREETDARERGFTTAATPPAPLVQRQDRDFRLALKERRLLPFPEIFRVKRDSATAQNPLGNAWAKQSAAFVHLGLYGRDKRFQKGFLTFLQRVSRTEPTEEFFRECFGMSYADMLTELRLYIDAPTYEAFNFTARGEGLAVSAAVSFREATQSEIGRIKGETLFLSGREEPGRLALIAPYVRGERDAQLLAALGLAEHASGRDERARKFLEAAFSGKALRPRAHLALAELRLAEAWKERKESGGLTTAQAAFVREPLLLARTQRPPLLEVYELFSEVWERSLVPPSPEQLVILEEGVRLFPDRLSLVYRAAALELHTGRLEQAATLVEYGLARTPSDEGRARFRALQAELSTAAANPAKSGPNR